MPSSRTSATLISLATAFFFLTALSFKLQCPDGFTEVNDNCYKVGTEPCTWFDAWYYCWASDSELVSLESCTETYALLEEIYSTGGSLHVDSNGIEYAYWTSGSDMLGENNWIWMATGDTITCRVWILGEPNNLYNDEHCIVMMHNDNGLGWNDITCNITYENPVTLVPLCETIRRISTPSSET